MMLGFLVIKKKKCIHDVNPQLPYFPNTNDWDNDTKSGINPSLTTLMTGTMTQKSGKRALLDKKKGKSISLFH